MKLQIIPFRLLFSFMTIIFALSSCQKERDAQPAPSVRELLTAKTWLIDEVNENYGTPHQVYKRGAQNNEDDFSAVRQRYHADGSITYTDQFGDSGTDGFYELLDNDTRIRLGIGGGQGFSIVADHFRISANRFSYRLVNSMGYTEFVFVPVQ